MSQKENNNWGIMVFKDTFEYLIDGDLTNDEFCELMRCIYFAREKNEYPNENDLPKSVRLVWKTLKNSVKKSIRNAKHHNTKKQSSEYVDASTGEVFIPTDKAYTSDLTIDPVLDEEQSGNLNDYILGHKDGMMRHQTFSSFIQEYPDAERLQHIGSISLVSANTLYQHLRQKEFQN